MPVADKLTFHFFGPILTEGVRGPAFLAVYPIVGVSCTDRSMEMYLLNNPINIYLSKVCESWYVHFGQIARFITISPLSWACTLALRRLFLSRSNSMNTW